MSGNMGRDVSTLAVSMGDPAGIAPEVLLKALKQNPEKSRQITVFGDRAALMQTYTAIEQAKGTAFVQQYLAHPETVTLHSVPMPDEVTLGQPSVVSGAASFSALHRAIKCTLAGEFAGIITGPIAKSAWKSAGHLYPGQTEFLAEQAGVDRYGMFLLATTHIPLKEVPQALSPQLLTGKLDLLIKTLQTFFGITSPSIAIAGLNPHSGEAGQLGTEEVDWLIPWLTEMRDRYPHARLTGPVPPDTLWVQPGQSWFGSNPDCENPHDAYLALYHDQGLIPTKLMAFDRAVNTTIGLPFIRTSPDHGTAFDIAGKGIADATSMIAAIALAEQWVTQRTE
jgi:4-hydroxythreonine-4-phosphate dehydrogenase